MPTPREGVEVGSLEAVGIAGRACMPAIMPIAGASNKRAASIAFDRTQFDVYIISCEVPMESLEHRAHRRARDGGGGS